MVNWLNTTIVDGKYSLADQPRAIRSAEENERMLALVDQLMSKGEENLTPEESALFDPLVTLIEKFETEHYRFERNSRAASQHPA